MNGNVQDTSLIGDYLFNLLSELKTSWQVEDIWLGDQNLLPHTPAACVIVGPQERTLVGAPRQVEAIHEVGILVYHCRLQDSQITEDECNKRAEAIVQSLNLDAQLGDSDDYLVIHGMVVKVEPGYIAKDSGNWYRSSRITWSGKSRFLLGGPT